MTLCLLCGAERCSTYSMHVEAAEVCQGCAELIANAYSMAHSGKWLTWVNAPKANQYKKCKISRDLSRSVFERDAYRCVTCGGYLDLSCDHITPESKGGETTFSNLQTMCRSCNSRKGVS